jgi:alpha-amylase/alpha-mannosidase (GH57 family)
MTLTPIQLDELIEMYCDRVVGEMDTKSMEQMLYDMLVESFSQTNENDMEELISAIYGEEYYQELVENVTAEEVAQED